MRSLWNRLSNEMQSEDADLVFNDAMLEWDGVNELRDCDHPHLMFLSRYIMACSSWTYDSDTNAKVLSFLESNELHGAAVMDNEDGTFGEEAADSNGGHIEVWDAANRPHVGLMEMNESQIHRFQQGLPGLDWQQIIEALRHENAALSAITESVSIKMDGLFRLRR